MSTTIETPSAEQVSPKAIILGKFGGAFSNFQVSCFHDLKLAGFSAEVAHKVAFDYGSDLGNAFKAGDASLTSKVKKAKDGGESRITIAGGGSVMTSRTMSLYRVCQVTESLYKEKLVHTREIEQTLLAKTIREYIAECEQWAADKTFAQG